MTAVVLTQDILTWYSSEVEPPRRAELLVETMEGYVVHRVGEPWPVDGFRWARLPPRLIQ